MSDVISEITKKKEPEKVEVEATEIVYYAWVPIQINHKKQLRAGEVFDPSEFPDENIDQLLGEGIIREEPYPKGIVLGESVKRYQLRKLNEQIEAAKTSGRPANAEILGE